MAVESGAHGSSICASTSEALCLGTFWLGSARTDDAKQGLGGLAIARAILVIDGLLDPAACLVDDASLSIDRRPAVGRTRIDEGE